MAHRESQRPSLSGLAGAVILALCITLATAACEGNSCPEQAAAARAAGLLGGGLKGTSNSCDGKKYPTSGSLMPITIPNRLLDLRWAPGPNGTSNRKFVFGLTEDVDGFKGGPLWRSDNYGAPESWRDQSKTLEDALPGGSKGTATGVVGLVWHPDRPERILFQAGSNFLPFFLPFFVLLPPLVACGPLRACVAAGAAGKGRFHFVSPDSGATFKAVDTPGKAIGFAQDIKAHPRQQDWLLAKARSGRGTGVRRDVCAVDRRAAACAYDLFVSKDFGSSWSNLTDASKGRVASFRDFDWGAQLDKFANKPTPDEAIFATKGLYPGWDKDLHYVVSLDLFASPFAKTVPCGNLFEVGGWAHVRVRGAGVRVCICVYVRVREIVAHKVYLAVTSDCPLGPDGRKRPAPAHAVAGRTVTMYISDADGDEFAEACLPINLEDDGYNMVRTHDDYGAFVLAADHAEEGSRGPASDSPTSDAYAPAYNASFFTLSLPNVYRREYITDFSRVEALPGVFIANQVDEAVLSPASSRYQYAEFLQTRISTNGGATWAPLPPPKSFRFGQCNTCGGAAGDLGRCSLHLHGPSSWFAPEGPHPNVYSHENAPGLIIATGNVGAHLDFMSGTACTWASHDGGLTWEDLADHSAIYEMGDHGGLIMMAQHKTEGPTNKVQFSSDRGACWAEVALPESISVENIRRAWRWRWHLLSNRECDKSPGSPAYEDWALLGETQRCLLGAQYSMQARGERVASGAAPVLGILAAGFEFALDLVIVAWDWACARVAALRGGAPASSAAAEAGYFEPLAEVDPEDHRSPPLFPGHR
eukprot:scaffold5.g674.t1